MPGLRKLIAGNWKMNGLMASLSEVDAVKAGIGGSSAEVAICPPATLIAAAVARASGSRLVIGAQDCHAKASGANTGDISAEMVADAGGKLIIVGHSERRADHGETDAVVRAKAEAVWRAGLLAVLCVGETEAQRKSGETDAVLARQLAGSVPDGATPVRLVIAYEPVWAIGTGLTASNDDIRSAHAHIRARLVVPLRSRRGGDTDPLRRFGETRKCE